MNTILCFAVLLVVVALSFGEECRETRDCHHVTCPEANFTLECHNRQCTCTQAGSSCVALSDCTGDCRFGWHCVDGSCRCGFGFGGGK